MRKLLFLAALGFALIASPAVAQQAAAPEQLSSITLAPELDRVLREYESGWRKGDAAALALLFAEDGFILQNGKPPVRGRAGIQSAYSGSSGAPLKLRALAASTADTIGFIIGAYSYDGQTGDVGKFTLTLKRKRGEKWLIFSDIDNGSRASRQP